MKFEIQTLKDKLKGAKIKVKNAMNSPRVLKAIAFGAPLMPVAFVGIKWAYSLLTGDHSHIHDAHQDVGYVYCSAEHCQGLDTNHNGVIDGNEFKLVGDVAHNPDLAHYDTNHDGVLSNVEMYDTYNQETVHVVHGLNFDDFHVHPNDLETIAKFDTNGDGQWNLAEFKAYIAQAHPELAGVHDEDLEVYKNVDLGGKYVPFEAD